MKKIVLLITLSLSTTFAKSQWINQNAGFNDDILGFFEMSIVDENTVWAIAYDGIGGLLGGQRHILDFTRTTDGGTTWVPGVMGTDTTLAFSSIQAISATEAWVCMHKLDLSGGGGIFHTTDGGVTWNQSGTGAIFDNTSFPNFVHFKDAMNGVAGGDSNNGYFEIYTTTDGGGNWTRTPQANIPAFANGGGAGWFDGFDVVGDTVWFGTSAGEMYKSTDFGLNWTVSTVSPAGYTVYEIAFTDNGQNGLTHVRSNNATFLFSTSDGGATWEQLPTHPKWKQSKITNIPGTNTFVSTSVVNTNKGSAYTTDFGSTWIQIDNTAHKAACRFLDNNTGWAGGYFNDVSTPLSGGLFKWDSAMSVSIDEKETSSFTIYPNPAADKICIDLSESALEDNIQFYNAAGELVKEVSYTKPTEVNIADLVPGVYLIMLKNNPMVQSRFTKQ